MRSLSRRELLAATGIGAAGIIASGAIGSPALAASDPWVQLRRRLVGALVRPGDKRYLKLATPRNLRYSADMPQAIALCADAADVATAISWARTTGTPFAVRGGGHNYASASSSTGLLISTRAMAKASLRGSVLTAQAGVRNVDLLNLLPQGGAGTHILPGGTCPAVGVAGLTLGGGIGPNAPWGGLSADHLREVTMVTADGDIVAASAKQNPGLFWGRRGSGQKSHHLLVEVLRLRERNSRRGSLAGHSSYRREKSQWYLECHQLHHRSHCASTGPSSHD